jgi:hypothetical protein
MTCFCGHEEDEHFALGEDAEAPGSTACAVGEGDEACMCIMYEPEESDD